MSYPWLVTSALLTFLDSMMGRKRQLKQNSSNILTHHSPKLEKVPEIPGFDIFKIVPLIDLSGS